MPALPKLLSKSASIRRRAATRACGRAALARIVKLHRCLQAAESVSAESLARELEVSSRTIKRDIELMRDQLEVPIAWDASSGSYYYTRHFDLLPLLRLEADEALALALAGRTFSAWRGSPLGAALTTAIGKIASVMRGAVSLPVSDLEALLFAPEDPSAAAEHRHFATLLEAIHRRRELRLVYQKPRRGTPAEIRHVQPLHLACLEHRWMLVAFDVDRQAPRNFLLARIRDVETTGKLFTPPERFDLARYLAGSLGRFSSTNEYLVRVVFDAVAAPYLRERPWHPSQRLLERADGGVEAAFRLNHLVDVERRVLACGAHAEVLAPPELRTAIHTAAAAMLARHGASPSDGHGGKNAEIRRPGHSVSRPVC